MTVHLCKKGEFFDFNVEECMMCSNICDPKKLGDRGSCRIYCPDFYTNNDSRNEKSNTPGDTDQSGEQSHPYEDTNQIWLILICTVSMLLAVVLVGAFILSVRALRHRQKRDRMQIEKVIHSTADISQLVQSKDTAVGTDNSSLLKTPLNNVQTADIHRHESLEPSLHSPPPAVSSLTSNQSAGLPSYSSLLEQSAIQPRPLYCPEELSAQSSDRLKQGLQDSSQNVCFLRTTDELNGRRQDGAFNSVLGRQHSDTALKCEYVEEPVVANNELSRAALNRVFGWFNEQSWITQCVRADTDGVNIAIDEAQISKNDATQRIQAEIHEHLVNLKFNLVDQSNGRYVMCPKHHPKQETNQHQPTMMLYNIRPKQNRQGPQHHMAQETMKYSSGSSAAGIDSESHASVWNQITDISSDDRGVNGTMQPRTSLQTLTPGCTLYSKQMEPDPGRSSPHAGIALYSGTLISSDGERLGVTVGHLFKHKEIECTLNDKTVGKCLLKYDVVELENGVGKTLADLAIIELAPNYPVENHITVNERRYRLKLFKGDLDACQSQEVMIISRLGEMRYGKIVDTKYSLKSVDIYNTMSIEWDKSGKDERINMVEGGDSGALVLSRPSHSSVSLDGCLLVYGMVLGYYVNSNNTWSCVVASRLWDILREKLPSCSEVDFCSAPLKEEHRGTSDSGYATCSLESRNTFLY